MRKVAIIAQTRHNYTLLKNPQKLFILNQSINSVNKFPSRCTENFACALTGKFLYFIKFKFMGGCFN